MAFVARNVVYVFVFCDCAKAAEPIQLLFGIRLLCPKVMGFPIPHEKGEFCGWILLTMPRRKWEFS